MRYIVPLGLRCSLSDTLKSVSLRIHALPFDWTYTTLKLIKDILEDNFEKLLDQDCYAYEGSRQQGIHPRVSHRIYRSECLRTKNIDGAMFVHHDPISVLGIRHVRRAVERCRSILANRTERKVRSNEERITSLLRNYRNSSHPASQPFSRFALLRSS